MCGYPLVWILVIVSKFIEKQVVVLLSFSFSDMDNEFFNKKFGYLQDIV